MKTIINFSIIILLSTLISCTDTKQEKKSQEDSPQNLAMSEKIDTVQYTAPKTDNAVLIADTIIYDVVIINPDPEDEWNEECLRNLRHKQLIDAIFEAVYDGRLKAYHYITNEELTLAQVKELEEEFDRNRVGKIQFVEQWYFDKKNTRFIKIVNEITIGYELYDNNGYVRGYKAGFKVYLNGKDKPYS